MAEATKARAKDGGEALGTGRRKSSVARVRLRAGQGNITINNRALDDYFNREQHRLAVVAPLVHTGKRKSPGCAALALLILCASPALSAGWNGWQQALQDLLPIGTPDTTGAVAVRPPFRAGPIA